MPVEKLFWQDPYATRTDAVVTSVDGDIVTLDRTVAFAFSGGQASDEGTIAGLPILEARHSNLEIEYVLPKCHGLEPGMEVEVVIDWPTRQRLMRLHFAAELVLELITQSHPEADKIGANITRDKARVDFRWEANIAQTFPFLEREIERWVQADRPITSTFSDTATQTRYWEIEGFARVACGGTHPRSTGEVGRIRLKRMNPGRGKERIEIFLADD
ncbi:MAG: alanyl-tRNA editing protein [Deferrisomatales bacterium]|nr:alanyl-tRNA editing protein [Deferrisomatales bacterium]